MANITDNIKRIENYFVNLNIAEGKAYILAKFPDKWTVFEKFDQLNVEAVKSKDGNGYYFFTDAENGVENLFTAIEFVENTNKDIEEKTQLLKEKMNELKQLFLTNDVKKLKTLEFEFKRTPKKVKGKENAKEEKNIVQETIVTEKKLSKKENKSLLEDAIEIGKEGVV